jgi:zinc protease
MKKLHFFAVLLTLVATAAQAQVPSDVSDFTSHGVHVILRSTKANQVVSAVLGFEGGLAYGETDNAVISGMTAAVIAQSGSQNYPKSAYRDSLATLSTGIAGSGNLYHMMFTLQTVRPNFNSAWAIFSDVITHSQFDTLEFQKIAEQSVKAIEGRSTDPDGYSSFLADSLWKGNSRLNRASTIPEVEKLQIPDLRAYRDQQFQRSRMVLVVVGNVTKAEMESKLAALESLPQGNFAWPKIETIAPQMDQYLFVPKPADFPTFYIEGRSPSADIRSEDWWAERVLIEYLDKRLFDEIRTKRNLSYTPFIFPSGNYTNFALAAGMQSVLPDSATRVMFDVFRQAQNNLLTPEELKRNKEGRITTYYYATQKNLRQAQALYTDQVEAGDWKLFFNIVPKTEQVTSQQVRDVARKYLHHMSFVLMGPEGKANRDVYRLP